MTKRDNKHPAKPAPAGKAPPATDAQRAATNMDGLQGEGNYGAARAFNEAERNFVESGKVPAAARAAAPKDEVEQQQQLAAEEKGKARAKDGAQTASRTRKEDQ